MNLRAFWPLYIQGESGLSLLLTVAGGSPGASVPGLQATPEAPGPVRARGAGRQAPPRQAFRCFWSKEAVPLGQGCFIALRLLTLRFPWWRGKGVLLEDTASRHRDELTAFEQATFFLNEV